MFPASNPSEESSTSMSWPYCQNEERKTIKAPAVWRTARRDEVHWRSMQTLQEILKSSLNSFEINNGSWKSLAADRCIWGCLIRNEQTRILRAEVKRLLRRSSAVEASSAIITVLQSPNATDFS